jgi:hypothetical protein
MAYITVTTSNDYDANDIRNMVWQGAKDRVRCLSDEEIDIIIDILAEQYPEGIDETELNDFFWFDDDVYAEWLGFENAEALWEDADHQEKY